MNRLDRLQAILIHLQSKKIVTAQEIADRFGISIRTVYRDIRSLEEAGVPVGAEAGTGYFLTDNFHLPPVMFTGREANALLIAAKLMEQHTDRSAASDYSSALFKIKAVLRSEDKERIDTLHQYISVRGPRTGSPDSGHWLHDIQRALVEDRTINISYTAGYSGLPTQRTVAPLSLCHYGTQWHLIAYCQLRAQYRDFRLDRIQSLHVCDQTFARTDYRTAAQYFSLLDTQDEEHRISIRVSPAAAPHLHEYKFMYGFTHQQPVADGIEMHFYNSDLDGFARWLLYCGHRVTVTHPGTLQQRLKTMVHQLKAWYIDGEE